MRCCRPNQLKRYGALSRFPMIYEMDPRPNQLQEGSGVS